MAPLFAVLGSSLIQSGVEAIGELFQKGTTKAIGKATKIIKKKTGVDLTEINKIEDLSEEQLDSLRKYDKKFALEELDKLLGDVKDARKAEAERQKYGTFLTRNTGSFLAIFLFAFTFFLCYTVIDQLAGFFSNPENITAISAVYSSVISLIIGTLLALCGQVATFYFGPGKQKADEDKMKMFQSNIANFDMEEALELYQKHKTKKVEPPIIMETNTDTIIRQDSVSNKTQSLSEINEKTEHEKRIDAILGNENEQL